MKKASLRRNESAGDKVVRSLSEEFQSRKPFITYAAKFAGLLLIFSIVSLTPQYQALLTWEVERIARFAHGILAVFGADVSNLSGTTLSRGSELILEVQPHCSGLHLCWLFASAVIAFPAAVSARIVGAILGGVILMTLNVLRIVSLFLVGTHYPGLFQTAHEQAWPVFSLAAVVALLGAWLFWVRARMRSAQ